MISVFGLPLDFSSNVSIRPNCIIEIKMISKPIAEYYICSESFPLNDKHFSDPWINSHFHQHQCQHYTLPRNRSMLSRYSPYKEQRMVLVAVLPLAGDAANQLLSPNTESFN